MLCYRFLHVGFLTQQACSAVVWVVLIINLYIGQCLLHYISCVHMQRLIATPTQQGQSQSACFPCAVGAPNFYEEMLPDSQMVGQLRRGKVESLQRESFDLI